MLTQKNMSENVVRDFLFVNLHPGVTALTVLFCFQWEDSSRFNCYLMCFVVSTMSTLKVGVTEKKGTCVKLRQQLEALEKDTAAKLADMDQYNKDMQVRIE